MTKKKYNVSLTLRPQISTILEIVTEGDETVAEELAVDELLNSERYRVHDFDGNVLEVLADDVTTDDVEEMGEVEDDGVAG